MAKQKFPHLVGSKWTAQQRTMGWRHFHVVNRKNQDKMVFAEVVAACDPAVRFWVNAKVLKNRQLWAAGWQTLNEIQEIATDYTPTTADRRNTSGTSQVGTSGGGTLQSGKSGGGKSQTNAP